MSKPGSEPAFPSGDGPHGGGPNHAPGISRRDYMATQIMASMTERIVATIMSETDDNSTVVMRAATLAYAITDTLIAVGKSDEHS